MRLKRPTSCKRFVIELPARYEIGPILKEKTFKTFMGAYRAVHKALDVQVGTLDVHNYIRRIQ